MDCIIIWQWCLVVMLVTLASMSSSQDVPVPPINIQYSCPNLNCSVTWEPPDGYTSNDNVIYSVQYQQCSKVYGSGWLIKTECTSITQTACHFGSDMSDVHKMWCVAVGIHNASGSAHFDLNNNVQQIQPENNAFPGPPDVYEVGSTSRNITIKWYAPKTPYHFDNGTYKRLDDFTSTDYNMSYWSVEEPDDIKTTDFDGIQNKVLKELQPWTIYKIVIQGRINKNKYGVPISLSVETKEEVPAAGVDSVNCEDHIADCELPNQRDVTVTWSPLSQDSWYGNLTHHQIDYWIDGESDTKETIETGAMATSIVLVNLSRWKTYKIIVHVCNSAGCSPHKYFPYTLESHSIDLSSPTNTSAYSTSYYSFNITWSAPTSDECIQSYYVDYVDGSVGPVYGLHTHIDNVLAGKSYTVYVFAEIAAENNTTIRSLPSATTVYVERDPKTALIIGSVCASLALIALVLLISRFWKIVHERAFYMVSKETLQLQVETAMEKRPNCTQCDEDFEYDSLMLNNNSPHGASRNAIEIGVDACKSNTGTDLHVNVMVPPHYSGETQGENYSQMAKQGHNKPDDPVQQEGPSDVIFDDEFPYDSDAESLHHNHPLSDILDFDVSKGLPTCADATSDVQPDAQQHNSMDEAENVRIDISELLASGPESGVFVDQVNGGGIECPQQSSSIETVISPGDGELMKLKGENEGTGVGYQNPSYEKNCLQSTTGGHRLMEQPRTEYEGQQLMEQPKTDYEGHKLMEQPKAIYGGHQLMEQPKTDYDRHKLMEQPKTDYEGNQLMEQPKAIYEGQQLMEQPKAIYEGQQLMEQPNDDYADPQSMAEDKDTCPAEQMLPIPEHNGDGVRISNSPSDSGHSSGSVSSYDET